MKSSYRYLGYTPRPMGQDMGKAKSNCEEHSQVCFCCDHEDETRVLSETTRKRNFRAKNHEVWPQWTSATHQHMKHNQAPGNNFKSNNLASWLLPSYCDIAGSKDRRVSWTRAVALLSSISWHCDGAVDAEMATTSARATCFGQLGKISNDPLKPCI